MIKIQNAIIAVVATMVVASFEDLFGMVFRLTQYGVIGGLLGVGVLFLLRERLQQTTTTQKE